MNNTVTRQVLGKIMITSKGEYNSLKSYEILDIVTYQGSSYLSKKYNNDSLPTNANDWQLLAQKGDTYELSEEDLQRIAEQITSNANSAFNQNVKEKTDGFNSNSNSKTEAYNSNATEKLGTYNSNHTAKLKEYNDNATSKLSAYNTNTVTKTTEYNSNHTNKLSAYDTNASNKVNAYNTNADARLEEYNTNANNKIAEYDEHSKELNNKIVSTRNELERLKSNVLNTGEDTDTFIHLEDSAMAELQEIKVDGVLSQETTKGYQLFDVSKVTTISNGTIENKIVTSNILSGDGQGVTYNFPSITLTANTTYYIFADIRIKSGTGYVNGINNAVVGWEKVSFPSLSYNYNTFISKYTPTENENIYAVYLGFNNANDLIINIQNVMITTDRNAIYEKYTGGQPSPSPYFPQKIKTITNSLKVTSCNKNVFKITSPLKHSINSGVDISINDNVITLNGTATGTMWPDFIWGIQTNTVIHNKCKYYFSEQPEDYTATINILSGTATGGSFVIFANDDSSSAFEFKLSNLQSTITEKANGVNRAYLSGITNGTKFDNFTFEIMLEKGSVATAFERRVESQIQAKLPENEFIGKLDDTYKDTSRTEYFPEEGQYHLMLDKMVGKIILDGTQDIFRRETTNSGKFRWRFAIPNINNNVNCLCDYLISGNLDAGYRTVNSITTIINNIEYYGNCVFYREDFADKTISEAKQLLAQNNMIIYYALQTPYTLDLGVIDMPMSYKDITNIFTDSDLLPTINAKYYRVFEKTIQNAQINDKTLKQEITDLNATVSALDNRLKALETKSVEEPIESEGTL